MPKHAQTVAPLSATPRLARPATTPNRAAGPGKLAPSCSTAQARETATGSRARNKAPFSRSPSNQAKRSCPVSASR